MPPLVLPEAVLDATKRSESRKAVRHMFNALDRAVADSMPDFDNVLNQAFAIFIDKEQKKSNMGDYIPYLLALIPYIERMPGDLLIRFLNELNRYYGVGGLQIGNISNKFTLFHRLFSAPHFGVVSFNILWALDQYSADVPAVVNDPANYPKYKARPMTLIDMLLSQRHRVYDTMIYEHPKITEYLIADESWLWHAITSTPNVDIATKVDCLLANLYHTTGKSLSAEQITFRDTIKQKVMPQVNAKIATNEGAVLVDLYDSGASMRRLFQVVGNTDIDHIYSMSYSLDSQLGRSDLVIVIYNKLNFIEASVGFSLDSPNDQGSADYIYIDLLSRNKKDARRGTGRILVESLRYSGYPMELTAGDDGSGKLIEFYRSMGGELIGEHSYGMRFEAKRRGRVRKKSGTGTGAPIIWKIPPIKVVV